MAAGAFLELYRNKHSHLGVMPHLIAHLLANMQSLKLSKCVESNIILERS
jgi:hypothetical protein